MAELPNPCENDCYKASTAVRAMPLEELPVPRCLTEYLRTNLPYGYCGGAATPYHNAMTVNHQRVYYCVAEAYEIPGQLPELMLRYFATRCTNKKGFEMVEVMRESPSEPWVYWRNMYFRQLCGWQNIYKAEDKVTKGGYYGYNYTLFRKEDFNKWQPELPKQKPGINARFINKDFVFTLDKYRYCGYKGGLNLITYLRKYNENHGVEFFGKLGIMPTKLLIGKAEKDGNFRRFLRDHAEEAGTFGSQVTLYAYKRRMDFADAYYEINSKRWASRKLYDACSIAKKIPKTVSRVKLYEYASEVGFRNYADYLEACEYFRQDFNDTKVIFPKDFKRMHDLRTNQMAADKAEKDRKAKEDLAKNFKKAAAGFMFAGWKKDGEAYVIVIPVQRKDLEEEGKALNHCVGRMGYDVKMIKGLSFIAFLRKADAPETPFVTIEFGIEKNKILQIYGDHDSKPSNEVVQWAAKWEKKVQRHYRDQRRREAERRRESTA